MIHDLACEKILRDAGSNRRDQTCFIYLIYVNVLKGCGDSLTSAMVYLQNCLKLSQNPKATLFKNGRSGNSKLLSRQINATGVEGGEGICGSSTVFVIISFSRWEFSGWLGTSSVPCGLQSA